METYRFNIRERGIAKSFSDRIDDIIKGCKIAACEIDNRVDKRPKAIEEAILENI